MAVCFFLDGEPPQTAWLRFPELVVENVGLEFDLRLWCF